jgi:hypothetical protein
MISSQIFLAEPPTQPMSEIGVGSEKAAHTRSSQTTAIVVLPTYLLEELRSASGSKDDIAG